MLPFAMPQEGAATTNGHPWRDDELDLIVSDYFAMLGDDLAGRPYVKLRHSQALMAKIGRSHRSVEFKHQNISAVLDELGMAWIPGYRPKENYQNAIFPAIERYLTNHKSALAPSPQQHLITSSATDVFVPPPTPKALRRPLPDGLRRLVAKFDPVERDLRNRSLGQAGEEFVVDLERRRLTEGDRRDLAHRVRWTAAEDGDGAGYDVASFSLQGEERLIEVKTTNGSEQTPFFLTRNEFLVANERSAHWLIYRVHLFAREPKIFTIRPPLDATLKLTAETWRASF